MESVNPATGERIKQYEQADSAALERALSDATRAYADWRERPIREREQLLADVAELLDARTEEYATLMTQEMGKPISEARSEVEKCAWVCRHYAEHANAYLGATHHPSPPGTAVRTEYEPLGPVLAVMPWNFPFWQVFRFAAPSLTAGNVGLLKHAPSVPGCAQAIEAVFRDAGYPDGVFQSVPVPVALVDDAIADERVRAVTLTGSDRAGAAVASTAGKQIKKSVLELGGSDPFIVLDDADVEQAVETGALARTLNGGQSCIAAKRFLVHTDVYDSFVPQFVEAVEALSVGDPLDETTDIGPLASVDARDRLTAQVDQSVEAGATVLTGGTPLDRPGAFYPPTVLADVPEGCPAAREELFGPVAAVFEVADDEAAIELANDTEFGLGASIWTTDRARGERVGRRIEAGCVYLNQLVKSDPRVPFGGIKRSGYGRELAEPGIKEFVNRKTVWVE